MLLAVLALPSRPGAARAQPPADSVTAVTAQPPSANTLVPLPVLFYQPETGTGFGMAATYYFRLSPRAPAGGEPTPPSSFSLVGVYTTKSQIIALLDGQLYPAGGRYWVASNLGYFDFPTKFWGVGNDAPASAEEDYTPESLTLVVDVQRKVAEGWFLGVTAHTAYRALVAIQGGGLFDGGSVPGAEDGAVVGIGGLITRDTRDNTVFPRSGGLQQGRAVWYDAALGSDYDFALFTVDLRRYLPLLSSHVLAFRALGMASTGAAPFDLLPQLGGDALLRGYYAGRFRDRQLLAFQGEYRAPVWWRLGIVGFVEAGQVARHPGDFAFDRFKTAVGAGLRIQLSRQEGLNVRADYGWGFDVGEGGFYLSLGEAF